MKHITIIDTDDPFRQIEVTHHNYDAEKGHWRKARICRNNIKINFFLEGDVSVFINDTCYRPVSGDICFLPPAQIHCGLVESNTHLDYFQLDIGIQALDHVTGGGNLLSELINLSNGRFFLHTEADEKLQLTKLFYNLESAVLQNEKVLSFAYVIEILVLIRQCCKVGTGIASISLSKVTRDIIHYIKEHYQEKITASSLSKQLNFSTAYLSATFKKEVGMSIHTYLTDFRVMRSAEYLKYHSIADTCYLCGFYDSSHYIAAFKKQFNCTPSVYKKKYFS